MPPVPPPPPARPDASSLVAPGATSGPGRPLDLPSATPAARASGPATGSDEQTDAQRPQAPKPAAPTIQRRPPTRRLEPGDLICPECGEGNPSTRKFCSRCGTSVADAQVVKATWWQKLKRRKGPKKHQAGARPSARKTRKSFGSKIMGALFGGLGRVVGVIMLVGGLVYGILPNIRSTVNEQFSSAYSTVKGWISPDYVQVRPETDGVRANSQIKGQPGKLAADGFKNTVWLAPQGKEPVLVVTFPAKVDLAQLIITNGIGQDVKKLSNGKPSTYLSFARAGTLHLVFDNGKDATVNIKQDVPKPQTIEFDNGEGVKRVEIHIPLKDVVQSSSKLDRPIALTEIEFFKQD